VAPVNRALSGIVGMGYSCRMRTHVTVWLAALLFASVCIARAETLRAPRILVTPFHPEPGASLRLKVFGDWPNACRPELESVRVEGRDIVLGASLDSDHCAGEPHGFSLSTDALAEQPKLGGAGIYRIRFEVRRTPPNEPEVHAFRLLSVAPADAPDVRPETGFWWPERGGEFGEAGPGLGVNMEVQADTLSLSVFGFEDSGEPGWQIGAGEIGTRVAKVELSRLRDGRGPFQPYRAPREITVAGIAHAEVLSPARVTLWFVRPRGDARGLQLQPVSMVRFRFAMDPAQAWVGRWLIAPEEGDSFPTRTIDFVRAEPTERGFALVDAGGDLRLRCVTVEARPNSPPDSCRLASANATLPEVDFDRVGLSELRGRSGSNRRVAALKLSR
jgi:hypothetical protein